MTAASNIWRKETLMGYCNFCKEHNLNLQINQCAICEKNNYPTRYSNKQNIQDCKHKNLPSFFNNKPIYHAIFFENGISPN